MLSRVYLQLQILCVPSAYIPTHVGKYFTCDFDIRYVVNEFLVFVTHYESNLASIPASFKLFPKQDFYFKILEAVFISG